ncbi:hypothetical protein PaG_03388 [Moesziomyces aphidis]|uniref:Uncharacterized protein n=1 Tax=Moesziomyces aphidis TaxID=84754 RepID=W3VNI7_MOEAP|nr:hypothetical protein PaG_03388 [Moesziomyces aphidis]
MSGRRWFAPSAIPPILLLTFVTSFAFNHALITTERRHQLRTHRIRIALLQDTIAFNTLRLYQLQPPSQSLLARLFKRPHEGVHVDADELDSLVRRWRAVGVNPFDQGLLPASYRPDSHSTDELRGGPKEVAWSEILLGSPEKRTSLTQRWQQVTAGIRASFSHPGSTQHPPDTPDDDKELEELGRLWSSLSKQ